MTNAEAEREIRQTCANGALTVPQGTGSAIEALGVSTNLKGTGNTKHDEATSDHNHPTRAGGLDRLGGWWVLWTGVCSGVFAALLAAPVVPIRTRRSIARKVLSMLTVFMFLMMQSGRSAGYVVDHESLQSHVPSAFSSAYHLCDLQRQRARDSGPQCSLAPDHVQIPSAEWDFLFAFPLAEGRASTAKLQICSVTRHAPGRTERFAGPAGAMPKFTPERWATDTKDLKRALVKGLRHGAFKF